MNKILSFAGALAASMYISTANAQENVNPLDRDLSALVTDGQKLVEDFQGYLQEGAAQLQQKKIPRTSGDTTKNLERERKDAYVDGMCRAIGLVSYPVVDENGSRLPMDATYQHPDRTVSLIGIATVEGIDEMITRSCPEIVGKGYDASCLAFAERLLLSVDNLYASLRTQGPQLIAYAAKELSTVIEEAYLALPSESIIADKDTELVQAGYFFGIEPLLLGIQGRELPERLRAYAEMYQKGVQEGSGILQNVGLQGMVGNSYALTTPTVEFSSGKFSGKFRESERSFQKEEQGSFDGISLVEEILVPYVQEQVARIQLRMKFEERR